MVPGNVRLSGFTEISVRLELDPEAFEVFMKGRKEIVSCLKEMGFVYITLDAEGFRSEHGCRAERTKSNKNQSSNKNRIYTNEGQNIINNWVCFC